MDDKGIEYVAIRPICTALNINYKAQHKRISNDDLLSHLLSKQKTTGADEKRREMLCLPVIFVFGWIFSINSTSQNLNQYKLGCIWALYDHFYGRAKFELQKRINILELTLEISQVDASLRESKDGLKRYLKKIESRDWDTYKEHQKQLFLFSPDLESDND